MRTESFLPDNPPRLRVLRNRGYWLIAAAAVAPAAASASISVTVDKLDAADGFPLPPPNLVVVDVAVAVTPPYAFRAVGLNGRTGFGARLQYAYDPNGSVRATVPGTEDRFVTFFSRPRERDNDDRFDDRGYVATGNPFCGQPPIPRYLPDWLNALALSPITPAGVSGYVLRIALDLSTVEDPQFRQDSPAIVAALEPPPNSVTLFQTNCPDLGYGALATSQFDANVPFDFGVYALIPEPATGIATALLAAVFLRRRE